MTCGASFGVSFLAGLPCTIGIGIVAGLAIGFAIGIISSYILADDNYDYHFQSWKFFLIVMGCSIVSGIAGGVLGSLAGKLFKCCNSAEAEAPLEGAAHLAEALPGPRIVA